MDDSMYGTNVDFTLKPSKAAMSPALRSKARGPAWRVLSRFSKTHGVDDEQVSSIFQSASYQEEEGNVLDLCRTASGGLIMKKQDFTKASAQAGRSLDFEITSLVWGETDGLMRHKKSYEDRQEINRTRAARMCAEFELGNDTDATLQKTSCIKIHQHLPYAVIPGENSDGEELYQLDSLRTGNEDWRILPCCLYSRKPLVPKSINIQSEAATTGKGAGGSCPDTVGTLNSLHSLPGLTGNQGNAVPIWRELPSLC